MPINHRFSMTLEANTLNQQPKCCSRENPDQQTIQRTTPQAISRRRKQRVIPTEDDMSCHDVAEFGLTSSPPPTVRSTPGVQYNTVRSTPGVPPTVRSTPANSQIGVQYNTKKSSQRAQLSKSGGSLLFAGEVISGADLVLNINCDEEEVP